MVERTCLSHPLVGNFYSGRYRLNSTDDIDYSAVVYTHNSTTVGENTTIVAFNLLYVDRLTETRENMLEIHSAGFDAIAEIYNALRQNFDVDGKERIQINLFEEQFADNVAGAVASLTLEMPSNIGACDWLEIDEDECC